MTCSSYGCCLNKLINKTMPSQFTKSYLFCEGKTVPPFTVDELVNFRASIF